MRWHREFPSRPHSQGSDISERSCDDLSCTRRRPAVTRRHAGPGRRLAAPQAAAEIDDVPGDQGPFRPGPGGLQLRRTGPGGRGTARGDRGRGHRDGGRQRPGTGWSGDHPARDHAAIRPGPAAALRPVPADGHRHPAHDLGPRAGQPAAPAAARAFRDQRRRRRRVPRRPGRSRLHRDQHAQDRRVGHRVGGERVRPRLLRPGRLPGAVAAVLQAGHGRGVRARLRDRLPPSGPSRTTPPATWRST